MTVFEHARCRVIQKTLWVAAMAGVVVGCNAPTQSGPEPDVDEPSQVTVADRPEQVEVPEGAMLVSRADFERRGLTWPLTVDEGIVGCDRSMLLWLEVDGTRYGMNGSAISILELPRFDAIWRIDEEYDAVPGQERVRVMPSDLLAEAQKRCA